MSPSLKEQQRRVKQIAYAILAAGLAASVAIYLLVPDPEPNPLTDQLENSKAYQRSLEMYGGKANILAGQLTRWFASLWHGKPLALTVAVLAAVVALLYYFIASPLPPEDK